MRNAIYWDTSALVKLYAPESDSDDFRAMLRVQTDVIAISFLHRVELHYALVNKELRGEIRSGGAKQLYELFQRHRRKKCFMEIPWGDDIEQQARVALDTCCDRNPAILLRTLDGIHLGAMLAADIHKITTTDIRLQNAASCLGLELVQPSESV